MNLAHGNGVSQSTLVTSTPSRWRAQAWADFSEGRFFPNLAAAREPSGVPPGFGLLARKGTSQAEVLISQSSGAVSLARGGKSGSGLPHSKTLSRWSDCGLRLMVQCAPKTASMLSLNRPTPAPLRCWEGEEFLARIGPDRKSTRLNSSHGSISY